MVGEGFEVLMLMLTWAFGWLDLFSQGEGGIDLLGVEVMGFMDLY